MRVGRGTGVGREPQVDDRRRTRGRVHDGHVRGEPEAIDREALEELVASWRSSFPDRKITVEDLLAERRSPPPHSVKGLARTPEVSSRMWRTSAAGGDR